MSNHKKSKSTAPHDSHPEEVVERCAKVANKAEQEVLGAIGGIAPPSWDDMSDTEKAILRQRVHDALDGLTPTAKHEAWMSSLQKQGWTYGIMEDPVAKTHPRLLAYSKLSSQLQVREAMFFAIVRIIATSVGHRV